MFVPNSVKISFKESLRRHIHKNWTDSLVDRDIPNLYNLKTQSHQPWLQKHPDYIHRLLLNLTHLVASLQVLHFVSKLLGLTMTLMLKLLYPSLDLLIQLLQFFYVTLKFFQQSITEEKKKKKKNSTYHILV